MNSEKKDEASMLAFKKILFYLKVMKKNITKIDKEKLTVTVAEEIETVLPPKTINIGILIIGKWIRIFTLLASRFRLEHYENPAEILKGLLRLQESYMEFSFGISKDDELIIKEDIHVDALTLDVFEEEYNAIVGAYIKFREEIIPLIRESAEITAEKIVEIW